MKKYIPSKAVKVSQITCDVCGRTCNFSEDALEASEFISLSWEAGYGASPETVFKDFHRYELDICQYCLSDKIGQYIRDLGMFSRSSEDQAKFEILADYDQSSELREGVGGIE
jgi:hypothetical protein